jgi:3-hydroxyacyl-[acyl-carrier-protein] dehydratase
MDWLERLPHQPPMRLLDAVTAVTPGESATAQRRTVDSDFFFLGHFPGRPIVPAVILVEMLAQAGGIAVASARDGAEPVQLRVAAIGPCKFPGAAGPGELLEICARVTGRMGRLVKIEGEVTVAGRVVASGSVTLAG